MRELLLDLALPETDRQVAIQWLVALVVWPPVLFAVRKRPRDLRHFVWGLAVMNVALFGLRTVH